MRNHVIFLYYTKINPTFKDQIVFQTLLGRLPLKEQQRILAYYQLNDQVRTLLGRLLLLEGCNHQKIEMNLTELSYDKYGRPYCNRGLDFNISHSGEYVICGISTSSKIGVDIEKNKRIDINEYKAIFSTIEWNKIIKSETPIKEFYRSWVLKEAILKQLGNAFTLTNDLIKGLKCDKLKVNYTNIDEHYTSVVVSTETIAEVILKPISFPEVSLLTF